MKNAKVLYELENGVVLRDGDEVIITTNEQWNDGECQFSGKIKVDETAICLLGKNSLESGRFELCIHYEFIKDVAKVAD